MTAGHDAYYEWDGSETAVQCSCGFYRIAENRGVAEAEFANHIDVGWLPYCNRCGFPHSSEHLCGRNPS